MKKKITILGLGQIGTSIGLGLLEHTDQYYRLGFDMDGRLPNLAKKKSAIDEAETNIYKAIKNADIILLALPFEDVEEIFKLIAEDIKENVLVLDTSPVREVSLNWAEKYFSKKINYVGFTPMISPSYIEKLESGFDASSGKLFNGGTFALNPSKDASSEAISTTAELAEILNANILFAESGEIDGLMAAVHSLPQFISAGLMTSNSSKESWKEGRKFAGRPFAVSTSLIENQDSPESLAKAATLNKENMVRVMDDFILEMQKLRNEVDKGSTNVVKEFLEDARGRRMKWMGERISANWTGENSPHFDMGESKRNWVGNLFGKKKKS